MAAKPLPYGNSFFVAGVVILCLCGCAQPSLHEKTEVGLGTIIEITVADEDKSAQTITSAIEQAFGEIKRIEKLFSRYCPESEISRINAQAGVRPVKVSSETVALLEKALEFSRLSAGAFDITVQPLAALWKLDGRNSSLPQQQEIERVLDSVGWQDVIINPEECTVFLPRTQMALDLGALAKGYAVDRAGRLLRRKGVRAALINAGGDICCFGRRNTAQKWRVALRHPRDEQAGLLTLQIEDQACATSGDYQRYVEIEEKRYSHIINPLTGMPCQDVPASVTVIARECLTADALATAIFVLGAQKGLDLVNRMDNTEAVIVETRGDRLNILFSQGLEKNYH